LFNDLPPVRLSALSPGAFARPVDSMILTPGQIAKIRGQVMRQLDYLNRLTDRIERQQFPQADPLRVTPSAYVTPSTACSRASR
jgi:hypothetical protein